jgi:hypothetical protein
MNTLTRRELLALGAAAALPSVPTSAAAHEQDWDWLRGSWDVFHSRLKERLVGSAEWQEFNGKSAFWTTMRGLGNVDDNSLQLPAGDYRGLSVRAFDPATGSWAIWWLDGRNPERIDPPVRGGFKGDEGEFIGTDVYQGTPVTVRFRWHEVRSKRPWWDQAFSTDGGKTWEINWRNYFTRTSPGGIALPRFTTDAPEVRGWDFLQGKWKVRNRKLRERFVNSKEWDEFDGTLRNWQVLGGRGNVSDAWFDEPGAPHGSTQLRVYNDEKREWLTWILDARTPTNISPAMHGKFEPGSATFLVSYPARDRSIQVRSQWTRTETDSPRCEQAESADGGKSWETSWIAQLTRVE